MHPRPPRRVMAMKAARHDDARVQACIRSISGERLSEKDDDEEGKRWRRKKVRA